MTETTLRLSTGRHATGRHHREHTVVAVASHALQPARTTTHWLYGRPEAVILPALALLLAYAEFWAGALILGAAGLLLLVGLAAADAARTVHQVRVWRRVGSDREVSA